MSAINIQRRVAPAGVPAPASLRAWARAALSAGRRGRRSRDVTIRHVDAVESRALNAHYRGKRKPTNVLSFPYPDLPTRAELGDLVICAPVVRREAAAQGKPARAHWAHMVVHGVLHLLGYDHVHPAAARIMEARERAILARFSIADPYAPPQA
jgi:probable rRNA maturation factor